MSRRSNGPVYYASKRAWFANIKKESIKLVEGPKKATEEDAWDRYSKLVKARAAEVEGDKAETWVILNAYLQNARTRIVPPPLALNTYRMHEAAIQDFCGFEFEPGKKSANVQVRELKMDHFQKWVTARKQGRVFGTKKIEVKWSDTYAHLQIRILRTAFKWAATEGEIISESPFTRKGKRVRLGTADLSLKRLAITDEEHAALHHQASRRKRGNFAELLEFLYHTGARPAEIYLARADEWDETRQAIVIDPNDPRTISRLKNRHHLQRLGRKRIIRLPDHLVPIMERLRAEYPAGQGERTMNVKMGKIPLISDKSDG